MSATSSETAGACSAGRAPASAGTTGARNRPIRSPPGSIGIPIQPPTIERNARMTSGTVIDFGDSWTCASCSAVPRNVP